MQPKPTVEQWISYQKAWDYFNMALFEGTLSPCILNFSRHSGSRGFFKPCSWAKGEAITHEISLNPDLLKRPIVEIMATLVHEQCHQWQQEYGSPSRAGYHNAEWAAKMRAVGLIPSDSGKPDGKMTGQSVSHYIDPDGKFIKAFNRIPKTYLIPWSSGLANEPEKKPKTKTKKYKYTCPECETVVSTDNEDLHASCDDCGENFLNPEDLKERKHEERD